MSDHVHQIKSKVEVLVKSAKIHSLIVESAAGWGKTTTVDQALKLAGIAGVRLGCYSTPLNLFRFLRENSNSVLILDDVAGLFTDRAAMAILKAAAWPAPAGRVIAWGSTTTRVECPEFEFTGKIIVVCNSFPSSPDAMAVKSRSLTHVFEISVAVAKNVLLNAAMDNIWFENATSALAVAEYLCARINFQNLNQISLRMLHLGYDLAIHKPDDWEELLGSMIQFTADDPSEVVRELCATNLKVNDQIREFERLTGLKRRTFFKYRRSLSQNGTRSS